MKNKLNIKYKQLWEISRNFSCEASNIRSTTRNIEVIVKGIGHPVIHNLLHNFSISLSGWSQFNSDLSQSKICLSKICLSAFPVVTTFRIQQVA